MGQALGGGQRVAFFGGSFDPPHRGHLAVARAAKAALNLGEVIFAPVGAQPLKPDGSTASFEDRLEMTRLAIGEEPGFVLSSIDGPKPDAAPNYTIDTLLELRGAMANDGVLFCLVGADSFFGLKRWHRGAEIPFVASLVVAARPGQPLGDVKAALPQGTYLELPGVANLAKDGSVTALRAFVIRNDAGERMPFFLLPELHVDISASAIREAIRRDGGIFSHLPLKSVDREGPVVPQAVLDYIRAHHLYQ